MIKKPENFQNSNKRLSDKIFDFVFENFIIILILFLILQFFFPTAGLIVNSISLLYLLYSLFIFLTDKRHMGDGIMLAIFIPIMIFLIVFEIVLLYRVFYMKKDESSSSA